MHSLEANGLLTFNNLCPPWNVKLLPFFSNKKKIPEALFLLIGTEITQWKSSTPNK